MYSIQSLSTVDNLRHSSQYEAQPNLNNDRDCLNISHYQSLEIRQSTVLWNCELYLRSEIYTVVTKSAMWIFNQLFHGQHCSECKAGTKICFRKVSGIDGGKWIRSGVNISYFSSNECLHVPSLPTRLQFCTHFQLPALWHKVQKRRSTNFKAIKMSNVRPGLIGRRRRN